MRPAEVITNHPVSREMGWFVITFWDRRGAKKTKMTPHKVITNHPVSREKGWFVITFGGRQGEKKTKMTPPKVITNHLFSRKAALVLLFQIRARLKITHREAIKTTIWENLRVTEALDMSRPSRRIPN